jgi:ubiquinone/menaquinone biosynthesis C-methylase UbiE/acyl carrier protein
LPRQRPGISTSFLTFDLPAIAICPEVPPFFREQEISKRMTLASSSYDVSKFSTHLASEIRRLDAQVDLFWPHEKPLLERFGLRDGMAILDCGCGPGRLLERIGTEFKGMSLNGLEIDPILVDACRKRFEALGNAEVRVEQAAAEAPGMSEESFDFITMRLVLEHLPDPVGTLKTLAKLLKPGGRIAIISNDFSFHLRTWPDVAELDDLYDAYCASRRNDGGDPCIGRRLPVLLRQAGLRVKGFEIEVSHSQLVGDEAFFQAEGVGIPAQLVESGYLDQQVFEKMIRAWKEMLRNPDHCIMRPLFVAVAERSPETDQVDAEHQAGAGQRLDAGQPSAARHASVGPKAVGSSSLVDDSSPATDFEKKLTDLWKEAMNLSQVGIRSNFFDLGGDSLMLEQLQVEIEDQFNVHVPMAVLFQYPTIEQLAAYLADKADASLASSGSTSPQTTSADSAAAADGSETEASKDKLDIDAQRRRQALSNKRARRPNRDNRT